MTNATVFYLPGTTNWGTTFGGRPTGFLDATTQLGYTTNGNTITIKGCAGGGTITVPDTLSSQTTLLEYPPGSTGSYTIPNSVAKIRDRAFCECNLTNVTIPCSVASIEELAFGYCSNLTGVYFRGNAPSLVSRGFDHDSKAAVYYLPGTTGWGSTFGGLPTAPWLLPCPLILNSSPGFGLQTNGFGFIISWATNIPVTVEACTDLANPLWSPVGTNTLTNGSSYFSDPQWTNYSTRCYRLRSP